MTSQASYVLVTAAYNEAEYIEKTLRAVIAQTVQPEKWIVVSDGSTDGTDEIVRGYAAEHAFIELLRRESSDSGFASQANALTLGCEHLSNVNYGFIGSLDADITFEPDYYEAMLRKFQEQPSLGIAGGTIFERRADALKPLVCDRNSVPGAIQLFRREAFTDIGGFLSLRHGGHDAVAETMARMHGWQVRTFPDVQVLHGRPCGASYGNAPRIYFHLGLREYACGNHPLFQLVKCLYRLKQRPYVLGSVSRWLGYCWAGLRHEPRNVPADVRGYLRREQLHRLCPTSLMRR